MAELNERLARVEESLRWIKKKICAIENKIDHPAGSRLRAVLLSSLIAVIVAWLSILSYILVSSVPR